MTLRAGAVVVDITPTAPVLMDGYGGRTQPAQGVHDPLMARVLVLEHDGTHCAVVSCDLLGMHHSITSDVRERAAALGVADVIVAATHNHAGPVGLRGGMFSQLDEGLAAELAAKIGGAIEEAVYALRTATLKLGGANVDTVSMNRRDPNGPIDPMMRVLLVDGDDGPIACLLNFACHGTVLNGSNLMLSGEFPGAAARLVHEQTGAPCVYLNGACGDVNPAWIVQDFASVERVGLIIGGQALRTIGELQTLGLGQRAHNIRWDEFPEKPVPGRIVEPRLRVARQEIDLPLRSFLDDADYAARIRQLESRVELLAEGSTERRDAMAQLTRFQSERWAAMWFRRTSTPGRGDPQVARTEVQAIALGDGLAVLALPGEFFVETARVIRERSGLQDLFVACYANDYVGYVIPADAYDQGGYESGVTFCSPEAESIIVDASLKLLREVCDGI